MKNKSLIVLLCTIFSIVFWVYWEIEKRNFKSDNLLTPKFNSINKDKVLGELSAKTQKTEPPKQTIKSKVIIYYFHSTHRCPTCLRIEKYSREAIEKYFANELKNGILTFKSLNVDEPENRHFIQDYQLYTKSLVITLYKNDKQEKWENLADIWLLVSDKEKFYQYVKDEVGKFLQEAE